MRILIDTNILIYREDPQVLPENLSRLLKLLHENGHQILVHPASIQDIEKDKNAERKKSCCQKLNPILF